MAINLAAKYSKEIANAFTLRSVVDGTTNKDYDFTGVKTLNVYTPVTQSLADYQRTGTSRYGTPTELQDTMQELMLTRDRSFSITIDKGNNSEQMGAKEASRILSIEMNEQAIPEMDKYALGRFADYAGKIVALDAAPTSENIAQKLSDGMVAMSNKNVPADGRFIFIGWSCFGALRLSNQFIGVESLAKSALVKGAIGTFMGAQVVVVPDDYLKKGDKTCYFIITHKNSVIQPKKVQDYFVKENPAGINGALLEGRFIYDAFVLGGRCDGVYAAVASGAQQAAPAFTYAASTKKETIASSGADFILYTTDGTDPRYSSSAVKAVGGRATVDLSGFAGGSAVLKAVAIKDGAFTSDLAAATQDVAV